jgi:hypothetical protein
MNFLILVFFSCALYGYEKHIECFKVFSPIFLCTECVHMVDYAYTKTEKLLLYGGAIHEAGAVKARRAARHATSDWMELEKQRGFIFKHLLVRRL